MAERDDEDARILAAARPARRGYLAGAAELAKLMRLLTGPGRDRVAEVYEFLGTHNNLGRRTLYLNLGLWSEGDDYDDACEALAVELGSRAGLGPGQRVFDAGFGFGDQVLLWLRRFGVARVEGRNVTPGHVALATRRLAAAGLADRAALAVGSALASGAPAASFDAVLALESAFHFETREDFFREAYRLLKPGGVLALADLAAREGRPETGALERFLGGVGRRLWQVPEANLYPAVGFRDRLAATGFEAIEIESVADRVFAPFKAYARARQADPEVAARANPALRAAWRMPTVDRSPLDYLVARAVKPPAG